MTQPQIDPAALAAFLAQHQQPTAPQAPQQFAPQMPQGFTPQVPQQPAPQLAAGSIDEFFSQPSTGGGPALKFEVGTQYIVQVTRPITNADIQQQTQPGTNMPLYYRDGRPKFVMKVPVKVLQTNAADATPYAEGGQWYVAGAARDELVRAMAEVGAPAGPPEAGSVIAISCTGTRKVGAGMNPAKTWAIKYQRPEGAAPAPAQTEVAEPTAPAAPAPQAPAPAPAATGEIAGLSPDQQALLAKLTGASS